MRGRVATGEGDAVQGWPVASSGSVGVALATYNGARFLEPFLLSLRRQSWADVELTVSDDRSTDGTKKIIDDVWPTASVQVNSGTPGVIGNFNDAICRVKQRYTALADQDDVWLTAKLARLMEAMQSCEELHPDAPVLIFSDLQVVDADLKLIASSFYDLGSKSKRARHLRDFVISNHIPGCTMLMNDALRKRVLPIPQGVMMHDWWIALVAATFGVIDCVDEGLVLYRQHGANSVGAPASRSLVAKWRQRASAPLERLADYRRIAALSRATLSIFRERFETELPPEAAKLLGDVLDGNSITRARALRGALTGENVIKSIAIGALM